jgi:hypothetical protein
VSAEGGGERRYPLELDEGEVSRYRLMAEKAGRHLAGDVADRATTGASL